MKNEELWLRRWREFRFLIVRGESECGAAVMVGMAGLAAMVGLAVFVKVEKIGVTGGASRRPYGNWVVYVAFAVMAEMEM